MTTQLSLQLLLQFVESISYSVLTIGGGGVADSWLCIASQGTYADKIDGFRVICQVILYAERRTIWKGLDDPHSAGRGHQYPQDDFSSIIDMI